MANSKASVIQTPRFEKIKDLFSQIVPKVKNFVKLQEKEKFGSDDMIWTARVLRETLNHVQKISADKIPIPKGQDANMVFESLKLLGRVSSDLYKALVKEGYLTDDLVSISANLSEINDRLRSYSTLNETINPNAINMLLRKFEGNIRTPDDISGFFSALNSVGMMFHPDDDFLTEPGITPLQADKLNDIMKDCWEVCNEFGTDIYELGVNSVDPQQEEPVEEDEELKTWGKDAQVLQPLQEEPVEEDGLIDTTDDDEDVSEFINAVNELAAGDDTDVSESAYQVCKDYDDEQLKNISKSLAAAGEYAILVGVSEALLDKQKGEYKLSSDEVTEEPIGADNGDEAYFDDDLNEEAVSTGSWDMNDPDVYKDTLDELVHFVKNVRQKSIKSGNDKEVAYDMASGYDTDQLNGFLHILASHPEMKKIADGIQMRANGEAGEEEEPLCSACNGTGEGPASGTTCSTCGGTGVHNQAESNRINFGRRTNNLEEEDEPDYDDSDEVPAENNAQMSDEVDSFLYDMNQGKYFSAVSIKMKAKELSSKYSPEFLEYLADVLDQNNHGDNYYDLMAAGVRENLL